MFLNAFITNEVGAIGLKSFRVFRQVVLTTGTIMDCFHFAGTLCKERDTLKIWALWTNVIRAGTCFNFTMFKGDCKSVKI